MDEELAIEVIIEEIKFEKLPSTIPQIKEVMEKHEWNFVESNGEDLIFELDEKKRGDVGDRKPIWCLIAFDSELGAITHVFVVPPTLNTPKFASGLSKKIRAVLMS